MEGDLIADPPVLDCEAIIRVPQYCLPDAVVKRSHAFFTFHDDGVRTPGHPVHGVIHHHVRRQDPVVLSRPFEVHMPPEVEEDRPMQRASCAFQKLCGWLHAVINRLFKSVHLSGLTPTA